VKLLIRQAHAANFALQISRTFAPGADANKMRQRYQMDSFGVVPRGGLTELIEFKRLGQGGTQRASRILLRFSA
jgi:hypothetical protein